MDLFLFQLTKPNGGKSFAAVVAESRIIAKSKLETEIRQSSFKLPKGQHEKYELLHEITPEDNGVYIIPATF